MMLDTRELKSGRVLGSCILMLYTAGSLLRGFLFVAAYLKKTVSYKCEDGNRSTFFTATLEIVETIPSDEPEN
jgi:hypothetical protein